MPLKKIRDLDPKDTCTDPEHNPPQHMVYQEGVYEWTCPRCGKVTKFTVRKPHWRRTGPRFKSRADA